MKTQIVQKCGCYEGDCVEILGLEVPLYACFTCGYAGVTPSGADNPHENEVHVHNLLAEVERLREERVRLREALFACAEGAGDDPFFNEGGEGYEALFGGEEQ